MLLPNLSIPTNVVPLTTGVQLLGDITSLPPSIISPDKGLLPPFINTASSTKQDTVPNVASKDGNRRTFVKTNFNNSTRRKNTSNKSTSSRLRQKMSTAKLVVPKARRQTLESRETVYQSSRNERLETIDVTFANPYDNGSHVFNASHVTRLGSPTTTPDPRARSKTNGNAISTHYIVVFSTLFFLVGTVGIGGNALVVYIVLSDGKMRRSMTNILILNLALADSITILFGIPEIVMFTLDRGWQLGPVFCSLNRSVMVCALYASVLILVAVCIERYIAIVFPIKAHILCTKKRIVVVIIVIWIASTLCATPTAMFNTVVQMTDVKYCITKFHSNRTQHESYFRIFKYTESALFYVGPLIIQVICYAVTGKRLFVGLDKLHRTGGGISSASRPNGRGPPRALNEAIRARKGVVKMLMASVAIYFLSYSPHQVLLVYETFSKVTFDETWIYVVLTNTLAYLNSAANPLMYCVFSDNFRTKFKLILGSCFPCKAVACVCCCVCPSSGCRKDTNTQRPITLHSYTEYTSLVRRNTQKKGQIPVVAV